MCDIVTYPMLKEQVARLEVKIEADKRWNDRVTEVLASVLFNVIEDTCVSSGDVDNAIDRLLNNMSIERDVVVDILEHHDAMPEGLLRREYDVSVTLPVSFTVRVNARSKDDAEEQAMDDVESNGLDHYYLDWNSYDAECEVYEV